MQIPSRKELSEWYAGYTEGREISRRDIVKALLVLGTIALAMVLLRPVIDDQTRFDITYFAQGSKSAPQNWTLDCDAPSGRPEDARACEFLGQLGSDAFAAHSGDISCTKLYAGPAEADIDGEVSGDNVSIHLEKTDSCTILKWNMLLPLLESNPRGIDRSAYELTPTSQVPGD